MSYEWLDLYCLEKSGAVKDYQTEWEATRYLLGGKMFAMLGGDKHGTPIFTMKLEPDYGQFLREQYKNFIVPGYYMNKEHWNSLYLEGNVPDEVVREMIDRSYRLIFTGLTKKLQKEITETI